jgi:hypothetical protein
MWDGDINPEGLSMMFKAPKKILPHTAAWFNAGVWVLEESGSSSDDPWMFYVQPGITYKGIESIFGKKSQVKFGVAYYGFQNLQGSMLTWNGGENAGATSALVNDYDAIVPAIEIRMADPVGKIFPNAAGKIPFVGLFAEYVKNVTDVTASSNGQKEDEGYAFGFWFGDSKIKDWGDWKFKYLYRYLEREAWVDAFPDSDALSGDTDVEGHELSFQYGVGKNTSVGLDYYYVQEAHLGSKARHILQLDWMMKF